MDNDETEVKDVERIEITPAGKDAEDVDNDAEETAPDASQEETEGDEETSDEDESEKPDEIVQKPQTAASAKGPDGLIDVEDETPRERALRATLTETRAKLRKEQQSDLLGNVTPPSRFQDIDTAEAAILGKYKPEEIAALKEVFPVLAKEQGYVRKDELESTTFAEKSQDVLDNFLDKHPEYLSENDKDGTLWGALKEQFQIYKSPTNPKDLTKILERVHRDVFGIKSAKGALPTINAQRERINAASHAGASSAPPSSRSKSSKSNPEGLRLDMLKGFTDEERDSMTGGDDE